MKTKSIKITTIKAALKHFVSCKVWKIFVGCEVFMKKNREKYRKGPLDTT